jgi:hypothetical protein
MRANSYWPVLGQTHLPFRLCVKKIHSSGTSEHSCEEKKLIFYVSQFVILFEFSTLDSVRLALPLVLSNPILTNIPSTCEYSLKGRPCYWSCHISTKYTLVTPATGLDISPHTPKYTLWLPLLLVLPYPSPPTKYTLVAPATGLAIPPSLQVHILCGSPCYWSCHIPLPPPQVYALYQLKGKFSPTAVNLPNRRTHSALTITSCPQTFYPLFSQGTSGKTKNFYEIGVTDRRLSFTNRLH